MQPTSVKKNWRGAYVVSYDCPGCGERLKSAIEDAGKRDQCPDCNAVFVVPGSAERERLKAVEAYERQQLEAAEVQRSEDRKRERQEAAASAARRAEVEREANIAKSAEAERLRQEREQAKADNPPAAAPAEATPTPARKARRSVALGTTAILLFVIYPWIRNASLRGKLDDCSSADVVAADVYYSGIVGTSEIVFDFETDQRSSVRRIDPVHLLMQFASKCDLNSARRVYLARDGDEVFYIDATKLRELASSYANGGEIWAFNNLPSYAHRMSGAQAYPTWTGGVLGVLQKQLDDLNSFMSEWFGE